MKYFHRRIEEKSKDRSAAPVLIVALGDSVTEGSTKINVIEPDIVYHEQLKRLFEKKYPRCTFCVINAGVGGENAAQGLKRVERDVIRHDPDLAIVGFCLNDACAGEFGIGSYRKNLSEIIRAIQTRTKADIVVLTPNWMPTRDNANIAEEHKGLTEKFIAIQTGGLLAKYAEAARQVAKECNVSVADVYAEWQKLSDSGADTTAMLANGLNHPDAGGHRIAAETIMKVIG